MEKFNSFENGKSFKIDISEINDLINDIDKHYNSIYLLNNTLKDMEKIITFFLKFNVVLSVYIDNSIKNDKEIILTFENCKCYSENFSEKTISLKFDYNPNYFYRNF